MAITFDTIASLHKLTYHYRNHGPVSHSRTPQRQSRPGPTSRGPRQPRQQPNQNSPRQFVGLFKGRLLTLLAGLVLLLISSALAWGILWKPVSEKLQNDPVIGTTLIIQVQVKVPSAVTKLASIMVKYIDADDNAYSSTYYLSGNTFVLRGEILHLLGSPARFRLSGVMVASNNINLSHSDSESYNDSALGSWWPAFLLRITHCSVPIGPINDTQTHTFTITVSPDGTSENSCSLQKS